MDEEIALHSTRIRRRRRHGTSVTNINVFALSAAAQPAARLAPAAPEALPEPLGRPPRGRGSPRPSAWSPREWPNGRAEAAREAREQDRAAPPRPRDRSRHDASRATRTRSDVFEAACTGATTSSRRASSIDSATSRRDAREESDLSTTVAPHLCVRVRIVAHHHRDRHARVTLIALNLARCTSVLTSTCVVVGVHPHHDASSRARTEVDRERSRSSRHGPYPASRVERPHPPIMEGYTPSWRRRLHFRAASSSRSSRGCRGSARSTRSRSRQRAGDARQALDQEGVEARRARARGADDGPDDARGRGHARARSRRSARRRCGPIPSDRTVPSVAAVCVYPNLVPTAPSAARGSRREGRVGRDGVPVRPVAARRQARGGASAVELGADEIDMVIDRGAFLSGRYAKVYDEIVQVKEACGERAPEGDPRDRRARHLRQRPPRVAARDGRRRRLHQDVDRQDQPGRDAAGHALHARGDPRRPRRDRPHRRHEARGRHPPRQAGDPVPRASCTRRSASTG